MDDYLEDLDYQKAMLERFRAKYRELDEARQPVHLYALLDQAGLASRERQYPGDLRGVSLYAGSGLDTLEATGPVLLAMTDLRSDEPLTDTRLWEADPDTDIFLQLLSRARNHTSRVTWIWTPHNINTLVEHLQTLLHARLGTDGEDAWFFFYHPSHLKVLHERQPEATRQYMFGPLHAWWMLDVHGELIELAGEGLPVPRGWEVLPVPADVVAALQRGAMPAQVHAWLRQTRMIPATGPHHNRQMAEIVPLVQRAFEHGLSRPADMATFVAYGLRYQVDYDRHPQLGAVLADAVAQGEPLAPAFRRVGKGVWRDLAQSAPQRMQAQVERKRCEEQNRQYEALKKIGHIGVRVRIVNASGKPLRSLSFELPGNRDVDPQFLGAAFDDGAVVQRDAVLSPLPGERLMLHWDDLDALPSGTTYRTPREREVTVKGDMPLDDGSGLLELRFERYGQTAAMYRDEDAWRRAGRRRH
ncbi:DUF4123 domain-containing protein [Paraburkholderia pallida]|uniref:DUF4123 domain-containing protein n=1 Tax=Paraburkholderia pallida TaxID=2547399 RepID=A0A4P7CPA5_9BURK|nr:DUF4123 domain-containing protein [Paraburkholderia pallida]QBQ97655.1 DUF4123 domain-containing protein [Paraburkholderia pallida]